MVNMTNPVNVLFTDSTGQPVDVSAANALPVSVDGVSFDVETLGTIGAVDDTAEPDPTQDATLIAATKGVNENLQTLIAAIGAPDDAAWSGSGDGTVISLLKAIAVNTTS